MVLFSATLDDEQVQFAGCILLVDAAITELEMTIAAILGVSMMSPIENVQHMLSDASRLAQRIDESLSRDALLNRLAMVDQLTDSLPLEPDTDLEKAQGLELETLELEQSLGMG